MTLHTTKDEFRFLDRLYRKYRGFARVEALNAYLRAAHLRTDWGAVEPIQVINYAERRLQAALRFED